jgi:hypothetical protein
MKQEWIALAVVAFTAILLVYRFYRKNLVGPLSEWFLKRGKVGIAMKIRHAGSKKKGSDCC